jgi:uncharacterized membrane protein YkvA (DUF1232 family)
MRDQIRGRARALWRRLGGAKKEALVDRLSEIDESYVERGAESITEVDLDTVVERAEAIEERFRSSGPLKRLFRDGRLLLGLVRDARRGRYRTVPVWTLSATAFTLLYVLNPFDVVPDALPLLGLLDDAAVVSACLSLVEQDLREYQDWRRSQEKERNENERNASEDLISS